MSHAPTAMETLRADILAGPDFFAHKLDLAGERALFLRLDRQSFTDASFLDDRILTPGIQGAWARFEQIDWALSGAAPVARPLHFIFHAGHVGSTLLSRLLEGVGGILSLREPLPLRTLAEAHDTRDDDAALLSPAALDRLFAQQIQLWRRGYADTRAVILKATSTAGRVAPLLLAARPEARAVYLTLEAEPFLATLLAGENSRMDLRGHASERMRRLERFTGGAGFTPVHAMSAGELAAMAWTVETLTRLRAAASAPGRVLSLDFEALLRDPEAQLRAVCAHFGLDAPESYFNDAARHPALARYSKAPDQPYSPALRAQVLSRARQTHGEEIRRGLAWIDAAALRAPAIADAIAKP